MDEYISREALLAEIAADYGNWTACNDTDESYSQGVKDNYNDTIRLINDIPAADVQPVKHGRWINTGSGQECSICKEIQYGYDTGRHYCPNCGCYMREDGDKDG